jgi:hypothetical protein
MWHLVNDKSMNVGAPTLPLCAVISLKFSGFFSAGQLAVSDSCNAFNHLAKAHGNDDSVSDRHAEGEAMRLPLALIAGLLIVAGAAVAEPPRRTPVRAPQPQPRPEEIMLASADAAALRGPEAEKTPSATPKRKVTPRVTTCRCGDLSADPESQKQ